MAQDLIEGKVRTTVSTHLQQGARTPFYFLDLDAVAARARRFDEAAKRILPSCEIAYSIKSNNLRAVLRTIADLEWSAEAVSGVELQAALIDGFPADKLIFNGPVKTDAELHFALDRKIRIQADSIDEIERIVELVAKHRLEPPGIGLRLAHEHKAGTTTRFGLDRAELQRAAALIRSTGLTLAGVHLHTGSNLGAPTALASALACHADFIANECAEGTWVDLGGGFPANSASATAASPPIEAYLETLARTVDDVLGGLARTRRFILEPGRHLVEDEGYLVTTITHEKRRNNTRMLFCDGGVNQAISIHTWAHRIETLAEKPLQLRDTFLLTGANCFESDHLGAVQATDHAVGKGDVLLIRGCGAYDIPSATAWIRPAIAVLGLHRGRPATLRRAVQDSGFRPLDVPLPAVASPNDQLARTAALHLSQDPPMPDTLSEQTSNRLPEKLTTEHLEIRVARPGDGAMFNEAILDSHDMLAPWLGWVSPRPTLAESEMSCRKAFARFLLNEDLMAFFILKSTGELVGGSGLHDADWKLRKFEVGYWGREKFRGKGYITEGVGALTDYALRTLKARRVFLTTDEKNTRSRKLADRLGFVLEGLLRHDRFDVQGKVRNTCVYARIGANE